ncbi:uroporphyrinogen-III synthase [Glutamicibacter endophyticus]|uniref:uroporphyrinogen-III synthase n=1 Tax=Glutamicibacter endophyticus TaxID=1522174 RepID=UPI003AF0BCE5
MGRTVLFLRPTRRAASTLQRLSARGIAARCLPLIGTFWPPDTGALDRALRRLAAGEYQQVMLTSVSTVQVFAERLAHLGLAGSLPPQTRWVAVGESTAAAITRLLGQPVAFVPQRHSAAGLVAEYELPAGCPVLYAHGDLASPVLADGLRGWDAKVDEVIAYFTRPLPHDQAAAIEPPTIEDLPVDALARSVAESQVIVFSAPSIVNRFRELYGSTLPPGTRTLMIGQPTARAAAAAGLPSDLVAGNPDPDSLITAIEELVGAMPEEKEES